MPDRIIWSPLAEEDFNDIADYLAKEWNEKVVIHFVSLVDHLVEQISINPKQYPVIFPDLSIRRCVITKHNSIFYRATKNQVDILRIYDTRQDPGKLRF